MSWQGMQNCQDTTSQEFRKCQKERGDFSPYVLPTSQNPPRWNPSWLNDGQDSRKDPELKWLATYNPETNPITIKSNPVSHMAEQLSCTPLPSYSPPRHLFPIKSLALSACASPQTLHFPVVEKSPLLGPERVFLLATVIYNTI